MIHTGSSGWSEGGSAPRTLDDATNRSALYWSHYNLVSSHLYLVGMSAGTKGTPITITDKNTASSNLNTTQTIKYSISRDGGSTYAEQTSGVTPAQITISAYKFNNGTFNSVSNTSNSNSVSAGQSTTYSTSVPAAYTGATSVSYDNKRDGYSYIGLYTTGNGSATVSSTYYPKSESTVYVRFKAHRYTIAFSANDAQYSGAPAATGSTASVSNVVYDQNATLTANGFSRSGYTFAGWSTSPSGAVAYSNSASVSNLTATDGAIVTLYAKWTPNPYTITLNNQSADSGKEGNDEISVTFDATINLTGSPAIIVPQKTGYTFGGYYTEQGGNGAQIIAGNGSVIASVSGGGNTYTSSTKQWKYPNDITLYAKWTQSVTLSANSSSSEVTTAAGSTTATYNKTGALTVTAPVRVGCSVEGYYAEEACTHKVIDADGSLVNYTGYVVDGKWVHSGATTLYAKWVSNNFVIYRSDDKAGDGRKLDDQVETYAGGTPSKTIEYRMKVGTLNKWYSLCLPFDVSSVEVWDETDHQYWPIQPYYRRGGNFYLGHYVIRTPKQTENLPVSEFGQWNDPDDYTDLPSANTPYIILWHDSYFSGKYVSFFGASGQTIPTSMTEGAAPTADNVVNIYANDAMVSGSVMNAYTFESDYGNGAWLRNDDVSKARTVPPFECYILANSATLASSAALRPRGAFDEVPTGWDDVVNSERQECITVYTITGCLVAHFENCSVNEAAQRLSADHNEGLFILRSNNESVKLMINAK